MSALPGFRDATGADLDSLMALNDAAVPHVNALTRAAWRAFLDGPAAIRLAQAPDGAVAALMVALPPGCDYGSENYRWFGAKLSAFLYVDRIVVAPDWRGRGLGAACYADIRGVVKSGATPIVCEVNLRPPNDASLAFHGKQGFREIGVQSVYGGTRRVVMLARRATGAVEPSLPGPDDGCALHRAGENDVPEIITLVRALFAELGVPAPSIEIAAIAALIASSRVTAIVARDGAGTAQGVVVMSEAAAVHAGGSFGVITEAFVAPGLRGRGLGARLIAAARREATWRGWKRLEVTTPADAQFAPAQTFYRANDFSAIGPRLRLLLG